MFETEKATDQWDLPHNFVVKPRGREDGRCRCNREPGHALHQAVRLETAAHHEVLTEKGI